MPMGGKGSRFSNCGYEFPKPLLKINGKPFFYWASQSILRDIEVMDLTFVVLKEHIDKYNIDREIKDFYPNAIINVIPEVLNGVVLTCIEGIKNIEDDEPIVFNDCDHIFRSMEFKSFAEKGFNDGIDGGLLTFNSKSPKYSYLKLDENKNVINTVEKKVISNKAICGCYYFKNKYIFDESVNVYLKECAYKELYLSGVYNTMVDSGKVVKSFKTDFHVPFGVPEEYKEALSSEHFDELIL